MKIWKRAFSFMMAVFMVVSMLPVSAYAEDGELEHDHEHFVMEEEIEVPVVLEALDEASEMTETAEEAEEVAEETEAAEEAEEVAEETEAAEEAEEVAEETEAAEEAEEVVEETEAAEEAEEVAEETEAAEEAEEVAEETEAAEEAEEVAEETEAAEEAEEVAEETEAAEEAEEVLEEEETAPAEVPEAAVQEDGHEHEWVYGDWCNYYGHDVYCGICGQWDNDVAHTPDADSICTVCGYNVHEHEWVYGDWRNYDCHDVYCGICDEWDYGVAHTFDADDICTVCGYENHDHAPVWDGNSLHSHSSHRGVCPVCNEDSEELHSFVNGICSVCGFEEHEENFVWTAGNEVNDWGHQKICSCGMTTWEWHECEESDVCTVCGYMVHDHDFSGLEGAKITGWSHKLTCVICGQEDWWWNEHEFEDGICTVCGYDENHEHNYVWREGNAINDDDHDLSCPICDESVREDHAWNENMVCTVCGYAQHDHDFVFVAGDYIDANSNVLTCTICGRKEWWDHDFVDHVCTACGYKEHYPHNFEAGDIYSSQHYVNCTDCGYYGWFAHEWDEDQVCTVCGYQGCKHENVIVYAYSYNSNEHQVYCDDCGEHFFLPHEMDEDNHCTKCDFFICKHEFVYESRMSRNHEQHYERCSKCYESGYVDHTPDDKSVCTVCGFKVHTAKYVLDAERTKEQPSEYTHYIVCEDCEGVPYAGPKYGSEEHKFDENKTCTVCGYVVHEHEFVLAEKTEKIPSIFTDYDHVMRCTICNVAVNEQHKMDENKKCSVCPYYVHDHLFVWVEGSSYTHLWHTLTCYYCGGVVDATTGGYGYFDVSLNHTLDADGVCRTCGVNINSLHDYSWRKGNATSASTHLLTCSSCPAGVQEAHTDDGSGVCTVCGTKDIVDYVEHKHNYVDQGDPYFHYIGNCNCYSYGGYLHTFNEENVCTTCGYVMHEHVFDEVDGSSYGHSGLCTVCNKYVYNAAHVLDEKFVCTVCGYEQGHVHEYTYRPETASIPSAHYAFCKICSYSTSEPHEFVDQSIPATKESEGVEGRVACRCGNVLSTGKLVPKITKPDAPAMDSVSLTSTGVKVTWGTVEGAAKYRVYYKTSSGSWTSAGYSTGTSMTVTGLTSGTKYSFAVRTYDADGEYSDRSSSKSITYIAAPSVSAVSNTTSGVKVTWGSVKGAVNYRVMYKTSSGSWKTAGTTTGTSFTVTGLTSGTKYYFTVRCVNADNSKTTSSYNSTGKSITYIAAPSVSAVSNTTSGVKVTWGSVKGAVNYRVMYKTSSGSWKTAGTTTGTSFTVKGLTSGTKYYFTVRCVNKDNTSTTSSYNSTGKSITYIAAPSVSAVSNTTSGVKVTWGSVKGAVNYRVMYKTSGGSWKTAGTTTGTSFTVKGLKSGTKYYFTVRCVNKDNTSTTSSYNSTGKSITYIAAPALPTVSNTKSGVKVTWTAVSGAAKYRVMYKTASGSWKSAGTTTGTSLTVKNLKSGTKYYFTVVCVNKDNTSMTSAYNTTGKALTVK